MKKITVAVCLDKEDGMLFNNRRQSRDRILTADLFDTAGGKVYAQHFSGKLLKDYEGAVLCDDPITDCPDGGLAFIENVPLKDKLCFIDKIIVYRWNRLYPADVYFDVDLKAEGFKLREKTDFAGSSHEKITKGVYRR